MMRSGGFSPTAGLKKSRSRAKNHVECGRRVSERDMLYGISGCHPEKLINFARYKRSLKNGLCNKPPAGGNSMDC